MTILDILRLTERARDIVIAAEKKAELSQLTHRKVRQEIEKELHLDAGTLDAPEYKKPLKSAITEALEQARQKKRLSPSSAASGRNVESDAPVNKPPNTRKESGSKQFKSTEFIASDAESEGGERKPVNKPISKSKKRAESPDFDAGESSRKKAKRPKKEIKNDEKSESEMSVLIDEPPKKKKSSKTESKPGSRGSKKKKSAEPLSNEEETIKRLKSLVVACGIRKVWSKVFEGMDKPSQQIKKLKEMLSDLGMKGRHSMEQAKAIREKRELAQELGKSGFNSVTGKKRASTQSDPEESEDDDVPEPKRRKGRNARQSIMAFLQDQSESE
ncbi:hypothetical protein F5887DRAFT_1281037 [Amanita rubescens]|nr:hypothetical protein F5887DRAFT_1281037 [Amanita rubescens]